VSASIVCVACLRARRRALCWWVGEGFILRAVLRAVWRRVLGWGMVGRLCSLLVGVVEVLGDFFCVFCGCFCGLEEEEDVEERDEKWEFRVVGH